jgi:predicted alpha/beta-hydrolase family hydrolase
VTAQRVREIDTPQGPGRATISRPRNATGTLVLGHGAGGQGWTGDLVAVSGAAIAAGWAVALVDQPWRLAGRKVATRPPTLDEAWLPIVRALTSGRGALPGPVVSGGRSAGARVACRTASDLGVAGVLCLAFPLHPPGKPELSRAQELRRPVDAGIPVHVVQGKRDPFGSPDDVRAELPDPSIVTAAKGTHSFGRDCPDVVDAAMAFLATIAR